MRAGGIDEARFLRAYLTELRHWAELAPGRQVTSIFFGGGTPSLMSAGTVGAILDAIGAAWTVAADAEITLEANPSSVEAGRFRGYRSAGVNRVSLGVQALDDADLRALGRLHTAKEALAAMEVARATFERCSFDMIYARSGQTLQAWRSELGQALALAGRHLSLYQLTIEPETPFAALHARGKLRVPDGEMAHDSLRAHPGDDRAGGSAGLRDLQPRRPRRGVPAQPDLLALRRVRRHRSWRAWARGDGDGWERHATSTERQPERWVQRVEAEGHGVVESLALSRAEQADEALLMGLRLSEGLDLDRLLAVSGTRPRAGAVDDLIGLGLIERCGTSRLRATRSGQIVLNEVVLRLASALQAAGE